MFPGSRLRTSFAPSSYRPPRYATIADAGFRRLMVANPRSVIERAEMWNARLGAALGLPEGPAPGGGEGAVKKLFTSSTKKK